MWLTKAHTSQEAPTSISGSSSLFILFDFEFPAMILNPLSAMFFIYLILISFFSISYERIIIKENYIVLEAIRNNKSICYSQKIFLDEINKI